MHAGGTGGGTGQRQIADHGHVDAGAIHIAGDLDHTTVGQVGNMVLVDHVEEAAIGAPSLQPFDDVGAMFFAALLRADHRRLFGEPVGEVGFEPVAPLSADAQIAARLAVDPPRQVDPLGDLVDALAIPGHIFADMAVGFGGVIAKAAQHVDADLFCLRIGGVHLEQFKQARGHVHAAPLHVQIPGLVVDAADDNVHIASVDAFVRADQPLLLGPMFNAAGDLPVAALHAMTEANGGYAAIFVAGPDVHRHGVGVVEEKRVGLGDFTNVLADVQQRGDG